MPLRITNLSGPRIVGLQKFTLAETDQRQTPTTFTGGISTFVGMGAGFPEFSRQLIVLVAGRIDQNIISATIGGVAATIHVGSGRTATTPDIKVGIFSAFVPSGVLVDVAINYGANLNSVQCVLLRATRLNPTPHDTGSGNANTITSATLDIPSNGVLVAACVQNQFVASAAANWTNATERGHFNNNGANNCSLSYAFDTGLSSEPGRVVGVSGGSSERAICAASFQALMS